MPKLKARRATRPPGTLLNVGQLLEHSARQLTQARLIYGHGTDNPRDDAAALIFHALKLDHAKAPGIYARAVGAAERRKVEQLLKRRIHQRVPAVYLTQQTWFAGLEFFVDERVLIPRSPIAELIQQRFAPWIEPGKVRHILDIGTGSGCIAVACAKAFPRAQVTAVDISAPALAVARRNIRKHRVAGRVRALKSNYFSALKAQAATNALRKSVTTKKRGVAVDARGHQSAQHPQFDIIVSNPPYVGAPEMKSLPKEYRHEPRLALAAGRKGLDAVDVILHEVATYLKPGGILVVEVGNTQPVVEQRYPLLPFTWLEFERGGGGVFLLKQEDL